MIEEARLLSLEERTILGLHFHAIPALHLEIQPSMSEAFTDAAAVTRVRHLLDEHYVPSLSTELSADQLSFLASGKIPVARKPKATLDYRGVLDDTTGAALQELFNTGVFERLDKQTTRPMSTWRLHVPPQDAARLRDLHSRWLESRICLLFQAGDEICWMTPGALQSGDYQNYVIVQQTGEPLRATTGRNEPQVVNDSSKMIVGNWQDQLNALVARNPKLSFVHFMVHYFLQPATVRELHRDQLKGRVVYVTVNDTRYRLNGVTPNGTFLLTRQLDQELVYDTTIPFDPGRFTQWSETP